jgi:hypothetical protein
MHCSRFRACLAYSVSLLLLVGDRHFQLVLTQKGRKFEKKFVEELRTKKQHDNNIYRVEDELNNDNDGLQG